MPFSRDGAHKRTSLFLNQQKRIRMTGFEWRTAKQREKCRTKIALRKILFQTFEPCSFPCWDQFEVADKDTKICKLKQVSRNLKQLIQKVNRYWVVVPCCFAQYATSPNQVRLMLSLPNASLPNDKFAQHLLLT